MAGAHGSTTAARNARRIDRWRGLALVCTELPDDGAVRAGQRFLAWLDENRPGLARSGEGPVKQFQAAVRVLCRDALALEPREAAEALERERARRAPATATVAGRAPAGSGRAAAALGGGTAAAKRMQVAGRGGGRGLSETVTVKSGQSSVLHVLPDLTVVTMDARMPATRRARSQTPAAARTGGDSDAVAAAFAGRATRLSEAGAVDAETVRQWLAESKRRGERLPEAQRAEIVRAQRAQWSTLMDVKHDPERVKQAMRQRLVDRRERARVIQVLRAPPRARSASPPVAPPHLAGAGGAGAGDAGAGGAEAGGEEAGEERAALEAAFRARVEKEREARRSHRRLLSRLRQNLQGKFNKTETLPQDLFRAFRRFDKDNSGVLDFPEFSQVCDAVGLGRGTLAPDEVRLLFSQVDKNGGGSIDFAEFLKVVVGNLVNL